MIEKFDLIIVIIPKNNPNKEEIHLENLYMVAVMKWESLIGN